jgi:cysteine synthase A
MFFSSLPKSLLLLSLGIALGASTTYLLSHHPRTSQATSTIRTPRPQDDIDSDTALTEDIVDGIEGLIGSTKLVRIRSLSLATGCEILAKAEVPSLHPPLSFLQSVPFPPYRMFIRGGG